MDKILRIKAACWEKGVKIKDLAPVLGISDTSLSTAITNDRFTVKDLVLIADTLGVPVTDLFEKQPEFSAVIREAGNTFTFSSKDALREWLSSGE